jgi:predicted nucleic acid-binding protein
VLHQDNDAGEGEALVLAMESNADLILLDDQEARPKARILDLHVTGTLGVLLKAKNASLYSLWGHFCHEW